MDRRVPFSTGRRSLRKRRFWSDEFKATAVEYACQPGVNMSAVARQIGILPSQL
ncbi:transposase [Agrobacterium sp. CCNWLW155]|uniref:transposase n=1 Tax=unclassified Agrobacterium TaxID=2632611 RepID=UPI003FA5C96D